MAAFAAAAGSPHRTPPTPEGKGRHGAGQPVVDEFTAPAEKSGFLERSRDSIEGLFRVRLQVLGVLSNGGGGGSSSSSGSTGVWEALGPGGRTSPSGAQQQQRQQEAERRIWLSLRGEREDVRGAKEYIKGLCEPELEEREHYPKDMHCIFVGAQNLFLNCLIHGTCADITVVEIGTLYIKGGAESVVMARSHIQQFVSLFKSNTSLLDGRESEVKKQFRNLVEIYADKYTMDLLILPSCLKRELLNLAQNEGHRTEGNGVDLVSSDGSPVPFPNETQKRSVVHSDCSTHHEEARNSAGTPVTELAKQMDNVFPDDSERHFLPINGLSSLETLASKERQSCKRRSSDAEERLPKKQFSLENNQETKQTACCSGTEIVDLTTDSSSELDGQDLDTKEGDEISEEMEYKILVNFFKSMGYSQQIVEKVIGDLGQQAEPLLLLEEIERESKKKSPEEDPVALISPASESWAEKDKDGFRRTGSQGLNHTIGPPRNEIPNRAPIVQTESKSVGKVPISNCKTHASFLVTRNPQSKDSKNICINHSEQSITPQTSEFESDGHVNACDSTQRVMRDRNQKDNGLVARGSSEIPHSPTQKETMVLQACAVKHNNHGCSNPVPLGMRQPPSPKSTRLLDPVQTPQGTAPYTERRTGGSYGRQTDPPVTGVQRFLESLKTPYKLELKNEPGREHLKYIVIDGSNVAISHGLQKFFSCRGIAIAVDYFWKRGHRKITVFVPQWRTRRDSNVTEQHFLTQLQDVGILALTPARVVFGNRIASHDDRFLLHLAEKTGGVIVTNDNLREFVTESVSWREIIQKRLLPYTFAGDIFMIPDDPLGRKGPGLDRFLQEETQFRGVPTQYGLPSGALSPLGTPHFLMQLNSSGLTLKSPLPGIVPATVRFPPAPQVNSTLPPHPRSATETSHLREALKKIFPTSEQREKIEEILAQHPHMRDLNALSAMVLDLG